MPEAFITAYDAMMQANLRAGETMLVHARAAAASAPPRSSSARALGATVVGTARTAGQARAREAARPRRRRRRRRTRRSPKLRAARRTSIVELVGGAYLDEDLRCIQRRGRIVLVGLLAGAKTELDLGLVLRKRVQLTGTVLRARPLEEKIAAMRVFEARGRAAARARPASSR